MNKNFKKNQESSSDNQNITTKKGFLLSIPGKKSSGETTSTINFSTPQNSVASDTKPDKNNRGNRKNGNDENLKPNRRDFKAGKKPNNSVQPKQLPDNAQNNKQKLFEKPAATEKNERAEHNDKNKSRDKRFDKNKNKNPRPANTHQGEESQNVQKDSAVAPTVQERRDTHQRSDRNKKRDAKDNRENTKNRHNRDSNDAHDTKDNHKNSRNRPVDKKLSQGTPVSQKPEKKRAPLSALSGDMEGFAAFKDYQKQQEKEALDAQSLEEKYKDAIPLADRIAAEDNRAKHPVFTVPENSTDKQEIVGIRFRETGKVYYFDPDGRQVPYGTHVIVETARGSEYGFTAISNRFIPASSLSAPLKKLERIATTADTQKYNANKMLEKQAEDIFREKVAALGLAMNLIYVEYTFDNSKLLFYFTAETRIDFRELVKELAGIFRTRIELRQIGVRDEAKVLGCLGICGRSSCCSTFLGDFAQVSIKMAKDQNLSLNAAKISGACGKLMCCLRYEDRVYEEENSRTPKIGAIVETPEGKGTVVERNALRATIGVSLENAPEAAAKTFSRDEVSVVGFNAGHAAAQDGNVDDSADEIKDEE